ncbi:MAG: tetratricopeptide repeat protein [Verrucomicrobiota bacterium]|nr:tetratricopeptide repeat protein [Verrucomicrobiota bacterium]
MFGWNNYLVRSASGAALALAVVALGQAQEKPDPAKAEKQITALQLKLRQSNDNSKQGANLLLELADLAADNGKPFTLIRAAKRFVISNPKHERQPELMLKLIDAELITARDSDAISTARQFISRHPGHPEVADVHRMLAGLLERDQKFGAAATELTKAFDGSMGHLGDVARAVHLHRREGNHQAYTEAARLAVSVLAEDADTATKREAAWLAIDSAKRSANQGIIIEVGERIADANVSLAGKRLIAYHAALAGAYWGQKLAELAVRHYAEAVKLEPVYPRFKKYFEVANGAALSATEMQAMFDLFEQQTFSESDNANILGYFAAAKAREKKIAEAAALALRAARIAPAVHQSPRKYVRWAVETRAGFPEIERNLKAIIDAPKAEPFYAHFALAFDLYRDRMKRPGQAQEAVRQMIGESPSNNSDMTGAMNWLLASAQSDSIFNSDAKLIYEAALMHVRFTTYRDYLREWLKQNRGNKKLRSRVQTVNNLAKDYAAIPAVKLWADSAASGNKAAQARESLLAETLTDAARNNLLGRQAYDYRHKLKPREKSVDYYRRLAKRVPHDYSIGRAWLEAAHHYGNREARGEAIRFLLGQAPVSNDPGIWILMLDGSERLADKGLAKSVFDWIGNSQAKHGPTQEKAGEIGERLARMGLATEATAHWEKASFLDLGSGEARRCIANLLKAEKSADRRIALLSRCLEHVTVNHGSFAAWLADEKFKTGDWDSFETTLLTARQVCDEHVFLPWNMGGEPALSWVRATQGNAEMDDETMQRLLSVIESMNAGLGSALAKLALEEMADKAVGVTITDQKAVWQAVIWSKDHQSHWDHFMPYARRFVSGGQHACATTLLSAMLTKIQHVDESRKKTARAMLTKLFTIMSEVEMDLDEDNPLAPLLKISLLLQIRDTESAVSQYMKHRSLFDERFRELPTRILLFAAKTEMDTGSEEGLSRAEEMLRLWLVHNTASKQATPEDQAAVQLLLARNYFESGRYDIARAEYTTVLNQYPETQAATDARFGIAQCYVEQKVFDKAEEIFGELRDNKSPDTNLRAEFLMGVMAIRQGDYDVAREMFQSVLERMPDNDLANETLYNLAEVFGIEQRFLDQLNMLRTIGRLGQRSKRWHTPGNSLFIVVHDSDLGISRGNSQIPVDVTSDPGGDAERVFLTSGSAGKGLFTAEIATILDEPTISDGVLQISGADAIHVDYPEAFKKEFNSELPQLDVIRIASDATFKAASRKIKDEKKETVTEQLTRQTEETAAEDRRKSVQRNPNQIRPGNFVYLRVVDYDRDRGNALDELMVNLTATNGDSVTGRLFETSPHSGAFEGMVPTAEMSAGATASDMAIYHSPLMAIDHDPESRWMSEPDGVAPKWLAVDMKDVHEVDTARFLFGTTSGQEPKRVRLIGSHDGRFFYEVARYPLGQAPDPVVFGEGKPVVQKQSKWRYHDRGQDLGQAWRNPAYDDSAWSSGDGPLGFGDLGSIKPATTVSYGGNASAKHPTTYFRKSFRFDPAELGGATGITARILSDDGFVLYLNGAEVARDNMPEGDIKFATLTPANRASNEEDLYKEFPLSLAALRNGQNVLAAEVHQPNSTSTDLGFDLELLLFSDKSPEGITQRVFRLKKGETVATWNDVVKIAMAEPAVETSVVKSLEWQPELEETNAKQRGKRSNLVVWSGNFIQRRPGAVRFEVSADVGGVMIGGRTVGLIDEGEGSESARDIFLEAGTHAFTALAWVADPREGVSCVRARENLARAAVSLAPFRLTDFVLSADERAEFEAATATPLQRNTNAKMEGDRLTIDLGGWSLRHLHLVVDEYTGNSVSVKNVLVKGGGNTIIPPKEDVLELAENSILEIAAGDSITAVYIDELTEGGLQQNRPLEQKLQATYFNGSITPVVYEFRRQSNGGIRTIDHELLRVQPGERIVAEVTDFDLDRTSEPDRVPVEFRVNLGQALQLEALETGPNTGVFRVEIDTGSAAKPTPVEAAKPADPLLPLKRGDRVYLRYVDEQNTFPGHRHPRESVVFVNEPTEAKVRVLGTRWIPPDIEQPEAKPSHEYSLLPFASTNASPVSVQVPLTVEVVDPDMARTSDSRVMIDLAVGENRTARVECVLSAKFAGDPPEEYSEPITAGQALVEGRFVGQMLLSLGDDTSPNLLPVTPGTHGGLVGKVMATPKPDADEGEEKSDAEVRVLNLMGGELAKATYRDERRPDGSTVVSDATGTLISDGTLHITDSQYEEPIELLHVGERLFLIVEDRDQDVSPKQDQIVVTAKSTSGENESVTLTETLTHSGVFTGSFPLLARSNPRPNIGDNSVECFFGDRLDVVYRDQLNSNWQVTDRRAQVSIAIGTDGLLAAFSKFFEDIDLAAQTRFHIAESYFELFKSQKKLERPEQAQENLDNGRRVLLELAEDFPDEKYAARVSYLLGQFAQEQEDWLEAIKSYRDIIRRFPDHALAPDAQYKMAQCHEEAGDFNQALEEYVAMAAIHLDSPLIPKVMIRINEYYYLKENYPVAARVSGKFIERFPEHELASRMAFRWGQCHYKQEAYSKAADRFEEFAKRYPDDKLCAEALFWAGESFRMNKDVPMAFRYYNRCRWDYPESEAAKYARGRLALPEMLAQFEREADLDDE